MPAKLSLSKALAFAKKLARENGKMLLGMQHKAKIVNRKGHGDYALDADIKSEKRILAALKKNYPEHNILTEEAGKTHKNSEYTWIIDPLEGTLNYAHRLPIWAVNIALWQNNEPLLSVVYAPATNELFHAVRGKGTYLNGKRIHVNKDTKIIESFFVGNVKHFCELNVSRKILRYFGCTGIELAYVADGRFTARFKLEGKDPYGNGAGVLLVQEAGGKVTDPHGNPWTLNKGLIASNDKIHNKLLKLVKDQVR